MKKSIKLKIVEMKGICRAGIISRRQYALAAYLANDALRSGNSKRMHKGLEYLCTQCGANTNYNSN